MSIHYLNQVSRQPTNYSGNGIPGGVYETKRDIDLSAYNTLYIDCSLSVDLGEKSSGWGWVIFIITERNQQYAWATQPTGAVLHEDLISGNNVTTVTTYKNRDIYSFDISGLSGNKDIAFHLIAQDQSTRYANTKANVYNIWLEK